VHAYKTKELGEELTISSTLADLVADGGQGVVAMNPNAAAGREAPDFIETPVQSTLAVPILDEHELQGVIILNRWAAYNPYGEKDLNLLSNIANKAAMFIRNSQIAKGVTRESLERERFRRLLSPEMAEMVVAGQLPVETEGRPYHATLLMANIIDFKSLTDDLPPDALLALLNRHFEGLVERVFHHEGMVDKCFGDRMLAVWGVPRSHDDDPFRAVTAAVEMQTMMEAINEQRLKADQPRMEIAIGVATGPVVAGSIGSRRTRLYSIIGDTVNTVQAICASARSEQVLICEKTFKAVRKQFDIDEAHTLQMRDGAVKCFEIIGEQEGRPVQPWSYLG
jgi:adenylate cyclase